MSKGFLKVSPRLRSEKKYISARQQRYLLTIVSLSGLRAGFPDSIVPATKTTLAVAILMILWLTVSLNPLDCIVSLSDKLKEVLYMRCLPIGNAMVLIASSRMHEMPANFAQYIERYFAFRLILDEPMYYAEVSSAYPEIAPRGHGCAPCSADVVEQYGRDNEGLNVIQWLIANEDVRGFVIIFGWEVVVNEDTGQVEPRPSVCEMQQGQLRASV